jgi:pyruvate/2-oxoglutarate dehydrogenase complex dihydrolipoamide acyltransferase (E2) component
MNQKIGRYHVIALPSARRDTPNFLDIYWWKHYIYGLLEVDVTVARQFIAEHKARTGDVLSFTGYLAFCLARAVDENKEVQAYLKGRKQLLVFDDVDVGLPIEREVDGKRAPMGHIIRGANHKTFLEIHQEIRSVQTGPMPPSKGLPSWFRFCLLLPWPLSKLFGALINAVNRRDPTVSVALGGTVAVTAVGMFGHHSGWGLVPFPQSLGLVVGGIARKPGIVDDRIEPREMLSLTVMFDHDVVDGAPAARFVQRLMELIESGYGLVEADQILPAYMSVPA